MLSLINLYKDIQNDFYKDIYRNSEVLYRKIKLNNGVDVIVAVYKKNELAEISISLKEYSIQAIKDLPKWKGMEENLVSGLGHDNDEVFLTFIQSEDYDINIYLTVLQDVINNVKDVESIKVLKAINETLGKWKVFFQFEKNYVLSENIQQGLFGELYILNKLVKMHGDKAVQCWTGCNAETQDFYLGNDALEVKSSSAKGPDKIHVSNEFQLDNTKIIGDLYLMYVKLRKSNVYGQNLPELIKSISDAVSDSTRSLLYDKLLNVGYVYQMPELYTLHFTVCDETCYKIEEGFPRIVKKDIVRGVSAVDYIVSLDACEKYLITVENYYTGVKL